MSRLETRDSSLADSMQTASLQSDANKSDWGVAWVLILVALAIATSRIAVVSSREGDTAFLSANDRSRWCTIAALVEDGTYVIDRQISITNEQRRRPWYTIDMIRHQGADGQQHYYSSKPPLFPTMIAGLYWCLSSVTSMTLSEQPIYMARMLLFLVNIPLLAIFYCCTTAAIFSVTRDRWTRVIATVSTCYGTMLMPFAIALNNHLPAAAGTALVLYVFVRSTSRPTGMWWWLVAGMAAGFTAANELPALSMTGLWCLLLLVVRVRALPAFLFGIAIVAIGFFTTNYIAHQDVRPPYMHRGNGPLIGNVSVAEGELPDSNSLRRVLRTDPAAPLQMSSMVLEPTGDEGRSRLVVNQHHFFALIQIDANNFEIRHWDDWYDYPTSYWLDGKRKGVDLGEPSRAVYVANMTIGHYGIFSLTPIWLVTLLGFLGNWDKGHKHKRYIVLAIVAATMVCAVFYVMRPEIDRNYGGVSVCFRWMVWFAPLWLFVAAKGFEQLSESSVLRGLGTALLACSVFSMGTALSSPWQSPWIYQFWTFLGWIER